MAPRNKIYGEIIRFDFPVDLSCLYLLPVSDLHIGEPTYNEEKIRNYLRWAKDTPNVYLLLNGDILDAAIRNSIGDVYSQTRNPQGQLEEAVKLFEPLKGRILVLVEGNHEHRIWKETGIDVTKILASYLGAYYAGPEAFIEIRLGKADNNQPLVYTVYMTHGWGAGRTPGAKVNNLQKLAEIGLADIYIASHTHFMTAHQDNYLVPDLRKGKILVMKRTYVSSGAYCGRPDYAVRSGRNFPKEGSPRIRLEGRGKKDVHVSI